MEMAMKHDEPKQIESSQALKAAGTSSGEPPSCPLSLYMLMTSFPSETDTYTEAELIRCATWCLQNFSGRQHVYVGLQDAAMLLFSTTTAVHGSSSRILCWSDLFVSEIPMGGVHQARKVKVSHENVMASVAANAEWHFSCRSLQPLLTMQSTTSWAVWMNMAPFDTALLSSALLVPYQGCSLPSSTSWNSHTQTLLPASPQRAMESIVIRSGMITMSLQARRMGRVR
jgi:hypothetical protein